MSNHSPAPWKHRPAGHWAYVVDATGKCVAVDIHHRDAALIAAAPALADLLRRIVYTDDYVADEAAHLLDSLGIRE